MWLCALALLGFQLMGHWHRVAHAPGLLSPQQVEKVAKTWGHSSGDEDCRLFDQLSHDPGYSTHQLPVCAMPLQMERAEAVLPAGADSAAHWKRGARGPPAISA